MAQMAVANVGGGLSFAFRYQPVPRDHQININMSYVSVWKHRNVPALANQYMWEKCVYVDHVRRGTSKITDYIPLQSWQSLCQIFSCDFGIILWHLSHIGKSGHQ